MGKGKKLFLVKWVAGAISAQPGASAGAHEHGPVEPQTGDSVGTRGNDIVGRGHTLEREGG